MTRRVAVGAIADAGIEGADLDGIGIANQRETVVAWDPATGEPVHRALVWQDRRTAERCDELRAAGHEPLVRERTGLVLDPYFSATKIEWLLRNVEGRRAGRLRHDRLLAALQADRRATRPTSPTPRGRCSSTSAGSPGTRSSARCSASTRARLPEPLPSAHVYGTTSEFGGEVPVAGIAGDQQAALFGQACLEPGDGQEHLRHRQLRPPQHRRRAPRPAEGLLTTVACGADGERPPTRWRLRSSSPAPPCSGCVTGSG